MINSSNDLIKYLNNVKVEDKILVCLPYAGAGASVYYSWQKSLPNVNVCSIQLPGREERIREQPYTQIDNLFDDLMQELKLISQDMVIFGHSMGAMIGYEMVKKLEREGKSVSLLIVSANKPPHLKSNLGEKQLTDENLIKLLYKFGGTPKEIISNRELLELYLPIFKTDLNLDRTYMPHNFDKVHCPIIALGGSEDKDISKAELLQWRNYTFNSFEHKMFSGGHLFIRSREKEVLTYINKVIQIL